jgi:DNA-binding NarL/FixJ family response regulator
MGKKSIRILLVDDHKLFREALSNLIHTFSLPAILYEAAKGQEVIAILNSNPIDLILLDIQMPDKGGIETLKQIREEGRQTKVIMLTQFDEQSLIVYLLQLGANGFLSKACGPQELQKAIIAVSSEGHYYDSHVLKAIANNLSKEKKLCNLDISPREFQVLILLKDGKSNKEIARNLGLTLRTIESYRKRLIKKTGSRNTVDLVSLGYRIGIFPQ